MYHVYLDQSKEFRISCTPENLEELITGRLYTENRISGPEEIEEIIVREQEEEIHVKTAKKAGESQPQNHGQKKPYDGDPLTLLAAADKIFEKPGELFRETGCAHCCALWKDGEILCSFEDIGRHNALDKAVGKALLQGISLDGCVNLYQRKSFLRLSSKGDLLWDRNSGFQGCGNGEGGRTCLQTEYCSLRICKKRKWKLLFQK